MKKLLIAVTIMLVSLASSPVMAERFGTFIPDDATVYYFYNVTEGYLLFATPDVKDEMTGWHTTCIGASFSEKGVVKPKPAPAPKPVPLVVKPPVVVPPPVVVTPPPPVAKPRPTLDNIYFDVSKSNISPLAATALDKNGATLKAYPDMKVEISGHTDNTGSEVANQVISEKRAKSAAKYLQDKYQIPNSQITTKGYGSKKPIADNSTAEGRAKNRRVEFRQIN